MEASSSLRQHGRATHDVENPVPVDQQPPCPNCGKRGGVVYWEYLHVECEVAYVDGELRPGAETGLVEPDLDSDYFGCVRCDSAATDRPMDSHITDGSTTSTSNPSLICPECERADTVSFWRPMYTPYFAQSTADGFDEDQIWDHGHEGVLVPGPPADEIDDAADQKSAIVLRCESCYTTLDQQEVMQASGLGTVCG